MLSSYECIDGHEPRSRLKVELQLVEKTNIHQTVNRPETLKLIDQAKSLLDIPAVNVLRRYLRSSLINNNFLKKFLTCARLGTFHTRPR